MRYRQAIDLLNSRGYEVQGIHLGLQRIRTLLGAIGDPHLRFPALHIAGTNGKGSVAAFSEQILREGGYLTGLYTSPHLVEIEERIRVAGSQIRRTDLARLLSRVSEAEAALLAVGGLDRRLTYFEMITASAFAHFAERKVDVAVVEVGLGGRLDATNVVSPAVTVITGIAHDHQELLGETLPRIAREKAGIIKPGIPIVSGCSGTEVKAVVRRAARRVSAPLFEIGRLIRREDPKEARRPRFSVRAARGWIHGLRPGLIGRHQVANAALSVVAVSLLGGFPVTTAQVRRGLAKTHWPGRIEEFRNPVRTIVDGAHNEEGARNLAAYLRDSGIREVDLVFGALRDKDLVGMIRSLFPAAARIHLTPLSNTRSADPFAVFALAPRFGNRVRIYPDSRAALESSWKEAGRRGTVVVAGSLYLVGEVLPVLRSLS